jgi:hypothetical protein
MLIKIFKIIAGFLTVLSFNAYSAETLSNEDFLTVDQIKADFKKFQKPSLVKGEFEQNKTIKELGVSIKTSGVFEITQITAEQSLVLWEIRKPEKVKICLDGNKLVYEDLKLRKKMVLKASDISSADNPAISKLVELLKMNPEKIGDDFKIKKMNAKYVVFPKKDDKNFFISAEITLNRDKNITSMKLIESNEDTLEIKMKNISEKTIKINNSTQTACNS